MFENLLVQIRKLNDRFSKILKIDLNYLMKGGTLLSITQISSAVFGFLLTVAFARYLPQEIYGTYRYILATYALLIITSLPGLDTAITETIAKGNDSAFIHAIKTKFKYGFIGTLLSITYGLYYLYSGDVQMFWLFCLIGTFLPFIECLSLYTGVLNAQKKYGFWAITEVATQAFSTLVLFLVIYFSKNIYIIMLGYFLPYIIVRGAATLYILKNYIVSKNFDPTYLKYGKDMTWFQILSKGISSIDQIVLFHFMGPVQVAIFSIANSIPTRFQSVLRITGILAFPKYANKTKEEITQTLPKKMLLFGVVILVCCVFYVIVAPIFFQLFFPKYLESVSYSQFIIFFTLSAVSYPFASYLGSHRKVKENYIFAFVSFLTKVICLIIFIPLYGIWGAVIGILVSSWINIFLSFFYLWRYGKE